MSNVFGHSLRRVCSKFFAWHDPEDAFLRMYLRKLEKYKREVSTPEDLTGYYTILDMLEDDRSRENFEREIYFHFTPFSAHRTHCSPCMPGTWERAKRIAGELLRENKVPNLQCPEIPGLLHLIATNFVMGQYEYPPHFVMEQDDVFIDCGGFIGDTAIWARSKNVREIHTFEPEEDIYAILTDNMKTVGAENVHCHNIGIGKENGTASFQIRDNRAASHIKAQKATSQGRFVEINLTSLDLWCAENNIRPTVIKMDIEGAEPEALAGARETIKKHKPKLAISLYHHPEHMYQLPLMIKEMCPEYRFWCKKSHPTSEFILFAVAEKA